ncbi:MAG: hypothetical protein COW30_02475 [Rhodospirillales bacterium CG15_BIG_FIL_POST_REV_8_21_14_020_66_15]|nr:MAG: hypothetical protein COW30_02475 [Rhodospirillales bacterium CG15_BIG_FIL_POST_REV_8_21_14_020_66_15]
MVEKNVAKNALGPKPRLKFHPPSNLVIDPRYQRSITQGTGKRLIKRIVSDFYWPFFGVIVATDNGDGTYCVIDGQHRAEAARQHPDVHSVPVMVIDEMTLAEQARAFVEINQNRVRLNALQIHRAAVRAGDPSAVEIDKIATSCGVEIPANNISSAEIKPGQTLSIKSLINIYETFGPDRLKATLQTIMNAYGDTTGDLRAQIFQAVAIALGDRPDASEDISGALATSDAVSWIERARSEGKISGISTASCLAQLLVRPVKSAQKAAG